MAPDEIARMLLLVVVAPTVVIGVFVAFLAVREWRENEAHARLVKDRRVVPDALLDRQWGE